MKRKKINRFMQILGLILIFVSILICFLDYYKKYKVEKETKEVIETIFIEQQPTPPTEETIQEDILVETPKEEEIILTNKYLGYIELINYGVKRLIVSGTDRDILDKGYVGILETSSSIDDEVGNLILAGHSVNNTFGKLHYMKIGEQIKIVSHKNTYIYEIIEKHTINDDDMSFFYKVENKKILTLITCKNNDKQRLIVVAELRGN